MVPTPAVLLVIGDRTPFDEIDYPDIDNREACA
jgi:hypothetical protein